MDDAPRLELLEAPPGTTPAGRCAAVLEAIDTGLHAANLAAANLAEVGTLALALRNAHGVLLGGLRARWWGTAWELQQLWVDAAQRRRGHATRLLGALEAEVARRGGSVIYLDTFSWQAPALYRRCGYTVVAEFAGFPGAARKFVMARRLDGAPQEHR